MNQILIKKNHDFNCHSSNLDHPGLGMLVVIDRNVDDISTLVDGVLTGAKVLVLDSETDSIEQITIALAEETFSSLHLVSHGAPGVLYLGNSPLTLDNLDRYNYLLQEWGVPEILLYGCNVAAGEAGSEFVERLHQLTGANIAASVTKTGNSALGGDWNLEVRTHRQPVNLVFKESTMAQYSFILNSVVLDFESAGGSNIFDGYGGFNWSNAPRTSYNGGGYNSNSSAYSTDLVGDISISLNAPGTFNFEGAYFKKDWRSNLAANELLLLGYNGSTLVNSVTYNPSTDYQFFDPDLDGIDRLVVRGRSSSPLIKSA